MKFPRASKRTWLLVILAGAFALRVAALGRADLWTDEIQTLHTVRLDAKDLVVERLHAGHMPLYFLIEKAWCALLGTSQFALRLPSALFGVALLVPAWSLLRRLAGERAAWWGTALLAVHPLFVELSREARMYSLLGLVVLVAADRALATLGGDRPGVSFWIAATLGPLVHPTWAIAMLPFLVWFSIERRDAAPDARGASRRALLGITASLAVLVAALAFAHPQLQTLTRRPWPREIGVFLLRMFAGSDLGAFHDTLFSALYVLLWAIALIFGFGHADVRARRFALSVGIGVPATSVAAGLLGGVPWGPARYLEFGVVAFALLAAIAAHPPWVVALGLFLLSLSIGQIRGPRTAWSDAAATLHDDPSPVVVDDASSRIVLSHYLGREVFVAAPPPGAASWWHASLVVEDGSRRVALTAETR